MSSSDDETQQSPPCAAVARSHQILEQLLRGRAIRAEEMADELGVSRRAVTRYFRSMSTVWDLESFNVGTFRYWSIRSGAIQVADDVRAKGGSASEDT